MKILGQITFALAALISAEAVAKEKSPRVTSIDFYRGGKDFVPERSFIANRGPKLFNYVLDISFENPSDVPRDYQEIQCWAYSDELVSFQFDFGRHTIGPGASTQRYFMIVPFNNIADAVCDVGRRPAQPKKKHI